MDSNCLFKTLILLAWGMLFAPGGLYAQNVFGQDAATVEISSTAASPGFLSNRFIADTGELRLFFLSLKNFEDSAKDYTAAGFGSPFFTAGPVNTGGLFREIFSPLGYTAGSGVFSENSRLSLRTAASKSSRHGIWAAVPGEYVSLGGYTDGDGVFHAAGALNLAKSRTGPLVSGLLMASQPESRLDTETWFPDKPLFPGGIVYHAAGRVQVPLDRFSGGLTRIGLSGAFSFGERLPRDNYYNLFASHAGSLLDIRLLQGIAGEDYVTPSGAYPSYRISRSAALKVFPKGPVILHAGAARNVSQVYKPTALARPRRLILSAGTEYKVKKFSVKLEGSRRTESGADGSSVSAESLETSLRYRTGPLTLAADYAAGRTAGEGAVHKASVRAEYRPEGWEFTARLKSEWSPDITLSGKISAALSRPGLRAGVSAELKKPLSPAADGLAAFRAAPLDYMVFSVFCTYKMKF